MTLDLQRLEITSNRTDCDKTERRRARQQVLECHVVVWWRSAAHPCEVYLRQWLSTFLVSMLQELLKTPELSLQGYVDYMVIFTMLDIKAEKI